MPKSASNIAADLDGFMKQKSVSVMTMPWAQLYAVSERERIKEGFQKDLADALRNHNLIIAYGINAVVIHRDSNFGPQDWKK